MHVTLRSLFVPLVVLPIVSGSYNLLEDDTKNVRSCLRSVGNIAHLSEDGGAENISAKQPYQKCKNPNSYCFTLWQESPDNGTTRVLEQGCWDTSGKTNSCERSQCISDSKPLKAKNDTKFCCCTGDMCNFNFTDAYIPNATVEEPPTLEAKTLPKHEIIPFILVASGVVFITFVIFLLLFIKSQIKSNKNDAEMGQHAIPPPQDYSLDKLKLCNVIGQGRYGSVWQGIIDDQEVAVKVFLPHHRNYFLNEHDLYKLAGDNASLLKCHGGGERVLTPGGPTHYLLILSLEQECLQEYLKNHTLDLATLCKMSLGVAKGLAHLHSDIGKPCIAHRDINTRNILVRADLSCCICDLGLAVVPRRTENRSLSEAGTLRYMAPEVLEGAVNLRDCECALKQIDVYALGLVLWELGMRCTDMQAAEPAPYAPPFFKEAGESPSLEQMQTIVSRRKARPLWPNSWKDTAAARMLSETAEDCWDQDAEARLTSLCVEERLADLPMLRGRILHPMRPPRSPAPLINNNHLHDRVALDVSVGTIETLLSPTEEHCKNSNQLAACMTPLQPYQGRNPCLERNLLSGSSDSLLVDKSSKHCTSSESQDLITNDFLNFQVNHRATPIPYVQNAVHGGPKQCNTSSGVSEKHLKFKWSGIKKLFNHKKNTNMNTCKETQVKLLPNKLVNNNYGQNGVRTSLLNENETVRPSTLDLAKSDPEQKQNLAGISQIVKCKNSISREPSLEQFTEVFSSTTDLARLKDPSQRVKTPGDVPPSVRRTRGRAAKESARFSLYDDSIMCRGQSVSAPDLEPAVPCMKHLELQHLQERNSVSSF